MSNVEFDEPDMNNTNAPKSILYGRFEPSNREPFLVRFLIKLKIAKTATQANIILLCIICVFLIATGFVIFRMNRGYVVPHRIPPPPPTEKELKILNVIKILKNNGN
jgi:hypothetical protein